MYSPRLSGVKKTKKNKEFEMDENNIGMNDLDYKTLENPDAGYNEANMVDTSVNPAIESFVNRANVKQVNMDTVHTFSVSFKAKDKVSESKVMEGVLAICDENGIDIEKFSWQKSQDKK
jgi:hypothetical protein